MRILAIATVVMMLASLALCMHEAGLVVALSALTLSCLTIADVLSEHATKR